MCLCECVRHFGVFFSFSFVSFVFFFFYVSIPRVCVCMTFDRKSNGLLMNWLVTCFVRSFVFIFFVLIISLCLFHNSLLSCCSLLLGCVCICLYLTSLVYESFHFRSDFFVMLRSFLSFLTFVPLYFHCAIFSPHRFALVDHLMVSFFFRKKN